MEEFVGNSQESLSHHAIGSSNLPKSSPSHHLTSTQSHICPRPGQIGAVKKRIPAGMDLRTTILQAAITRYKKKLRDSYLPEANQLLQVNLVDANRQQLRDSLLQIRDYIHRAKTNIQEALAKWTNEIAKCGDKNAREKKAEVFLQYASPGDVGEVVDEAEKLILAVDRRINYIMNPFVVLPLPAPAAAVRVHQPVPIVPQHTEGTKKASERETEAAGTGQPNDPPTFDSVQETFMSLDGPPIRQCTPLKPSTI
ncbi:MAG: hypothetical protein GY696_25885, partial [Gammaproteobacteria bacterium]|nr:hypothetical protein [Gammaproteobacteria bacterium]